MNKTEYIFKWFYDTIKDDIKRSTRFNEDDFYSEYEGKIESGITYSTGLYGIDQEFNDENEDIELTQNILTKCVKLADVKIVNQEKKIQRLEKLNIEVSFHEIFELFLLKTVKNTLESIRKNTIKFNRELRGERFERKHKRSVSETYAQAPLMNIKNQLSNILGNDFEITGGGIIPKFVIKPINYPNIEFNVTQSNGGIEITPVVDGVMDLLNKRKNIAFMRASSIIPDCIKELIRKYVKNESFSIIGKLKIRE